MNADSHCLVITNIEERVLDTNDERDKADAFDDVAFTPEKKKAKVVDKHDNVVVLSFDADTDGNA